MTRKNRNVDIYGCWLTNKSTYSKEHEFPEIYSFIDDSIEYLCLPNELTKARNNKNACLCFYVDDRKFDTIDGLYNAIIYKNQELLNKYKKKYEGIKYVIAPDYSTYFEMSKACLINQITKARVVTLWFQLENNSIAIPNITFSIKDYDDICNEGIVKGSAVAFSLKGLLQREVTKKRALEIIKKVVDEIEPLMIVVYSVANDALTKEYFKYAMDKKINICIPSNSLKIANDSKRRIQNGQRA